MDAEKTETVGGSKEREGRQHKKVSLSKMEIREPLCADPRMKGDGGRKNPLQKGGKKTKGRESFTPKKKKRTPRRISPKEDATEKKKQKNQKKK